MLEENHDLEKIIEDAKEYRWYSIPDMYMVQILDTTGRSAGYAQSIFIDKYEAKEVAKELHGIVRQVFQDEQNRDETNVVRNVSRGHIR